MLANLIQKLENIEYKLMKIKTEGCLSGCFLPKERCRSMTNMVNILSSLVNKTTYNQSHEDDIALSHNKCDITGDESTFSNLISSEAFFKEVQNVLKSKPMSGEIHNYLLNFQELLGDIVFSICEINNCQMKLASGIQVKDLVTMKNVYSSLWKLLSSMFYQNSLIPCDHEKTQRNQTKEHSSEVDINVSDLVDAIQSCLKEMSKVKLEIEHYIKFNLIEIQFNEPENENKLRKSDVTEDKAKLNKAAKHLKSQDNMFVNHDVKKENSSDVFSQECSELRGRQKPSLYNIPSSQAASQDNYLGSYILPPKMGCWDNCYDCKLIEDSYGNFLNGPIIYPPDVLFFEPPTVIFQSQVEPTPKHSLLRIYSMDSTNDSTILNDINTKNPSDDTEQIKSTPSIDCSNKKVNSINKSLFENTHEDLFSESPDNEGSEAKYVHIKEKISSLFNMLRTNQISDDEDIFDTSPLKIEKRDSSCSKKPIVKNQEIKLKKRTNLKDKHLRRNVASYLQNENQEKQRTEKHKSKIETYKELLKKGRLSTEFWEPDQNEVIYDKRSGIQLFKSNTRESFKPETAPIEESTFSMWPVAAKYIYVGKGQGTENCHSVSSSTSISLAKSFEKSFFSLHLNKKYEQNQLYDGDLIVLNHTGTLQSERDSAYSLCKESSVEYDELEAADKNHITHLYPRNCIDTKIGNGPMIPFNKPLVPTKHSLQTQQQTYTVHYADCEDSFVVNKNYKKEKIDFFNFNRYDDTQNWDSFISIVASKVGPNTHINQQRMFRKIVKNLGAESLNNDNIFTNVHTLTSNSGPFRLFDINGYPLTDTTGNVLKDPYGKSVVQLDSTGFPKDDIKVFDAAGNSPKDINFDPTQKPQSNCIVVKLTDNFKRPLHLFDKYGRPLTDANGKLLVNIHGRPLLRFDNFGRPNTDYRGGPLYTDNGFRWSYKAGQSHSKEQLSNETLTLRKFNSQNIYKGDKSVSTEVTDENLKCENNSGPDQTKQDNYRYVDSRSSDIWLQVETVLQKHSKKNKTEVQHSQTKLIINNDAVLQNPETKQYLDSIICHDDKVNKLTHDYGGNEVQQIFSMKLGDCKVMDDSTKDQICIEDKVNHGAKTDLLGTSKTHVPFQFYNDTFLRNTCSNCFTSTQFSQKLPDCHKPSFFLEKKEICKRPQLLIHDDVMTKNRIMGIPLCHPNIVANNIPSIFSFKNHEYLNNLCNQILKNKLESRANLKGVDTKTSELRSVFTGAKDHFTDTTLSDFTSSIVSKYTNDIPLYTDTPAVSIDSQNKDPQIMKILENIDSKFKKHDKLKNISSKSGDLKNQENVQEVSLEKNQYKSHIQKVNKNNKRFEENPKAKFESSRTSEETNTYVDIHNTGNHQYKINIQERIRAGVQYCGDENFKYTNSNGISNDTDYPDQENDKGRQNKNIPEKQQFLQSIELSPDVYHGEYCRHFKNKKDPTRDSPFRFPSNEQMQNTIAMNHDVVYVNEKNWLGLNKNKIKHKYHEKEIHKQEHFYPKKEKKTGRCNRDCNLVSLFGTPVKYVLNKLDNKLSKQQGREKKHYHLKTPYMDGMKIKTLYHSTANKNDVTSTETEESHIKDKRWQKQGKKGELLAFKSKSYSEVRVNKTGNMSYSGTIETSDKYSPQSSSQYKCSSDTVVISHYRQEHKQRKNRKHEMKKPKNEQYSFETNHVHTSHRPCRDEKSPAYKKHSSKSPKSKNKTAKLFKKSGSSGRKRVR